MRTRRDRTHRVLTAAIALLAVLFARPAKSADWPCWRGPQRDGISRETGLLKQWPNEGPRQLWRAELSGGYSSVVVADGRLFTHTKGDAQEIVRCFDASSGKELWRYAYDCDYRDFPMLKGGLPPEQWLSGPRATPAVDGNRVYTVGTTGTLLCLDTKTGKKIWQQDLTRIGERECPRQGYCASPLIVAERLYVHPGGPNGKSIAALDKTHGSVIWQALDDPPGLGTPVWTEIEGSPQLVFFTATGAVGADPRDGRALWRYPWKTRFDLNIATPICSDGMVFISSNYGTGGAVFRVTGPGAPKTIWKSGAMQNHFATSVLYQGHLYGFSEGRLRCVEFLTGKIKWDKPGLGKGSLVIADGKLIILGEHGELVLAQASPANYTELSRSQVLSRERLSWSVPVLSGGRLFARNETELVAIDLTGNGN